MRYSSFLFGLLWGVLSLTPAHAAETSGWPTLTLATGGYSASGSEDLDPCMVYGVKLGYEFNGKTMSDRLGFEGVLYQGKARSTQDDTDVDLTLARLDLFYLFNPKNKKIKPFLTFGAGARIVSWVDGNDSSPVAAYGLGMKYFVADYLALRGELRQVLVFDDQRTNDYEYVLGLTYLFGVERKPRPKPVVDSDGDGVDDQKDQCPNTPKVFKVDRKGCPVNPTDTDDDGIPDYLDQCMDTPSGFFVDQKGCPMDADRDGVPDELDKCPSNPPGFKVDKDGCMDMEVK